MAPEEKEKKRKAPSATTSSDKRIKKQKTATEPRTIATEVAPDAIKAPFSSLTAADSNQLVVKAKKDRKRAADFLSDNEDGAEVSTNKPMVTDAAIKGKKKSKSKQDKTETESTANTNDVKPKKKTKTSGLKGLANAAITADVRKTNAPKSKPKRIGDKAMSSGDFLRVDGVNGVLEHVGDQDVEITTASLKPFNSMQAEAQRTVDKEIADEVASEDESDDQGAVLLAGFDSDSEDLGKDEGLDPANMKDLELDKKQRKKLRQAVRKTATDGPGAVYVGRIPHGFHENEMRQYFSQFGTITNLRLSRNKQTGASKHFAFVEFESNEVAKIVAQTMDNYLMFGHILKCKYAPADALHPDTWKGANKRFKKIPYNKIEKKKLEEPKTKHQWTTKIAREQSKRAAKAERMKSMGYEYDLPQLQTVEGALEQKRLAQRDEPKAVEFAAAVEESTGAMQPPNGVPKDVVVLAKEKKSKRSKKSEAVINASTPEAIADAHSIVTEPKKAKTSKKAAAAPESSVIATNGDAQTDTAEEVTKPVDSKKTRSSKKSIVTAVAPVEASLSTARPEIEPPKFAFHPDEIKELTKIKSKKSKKSKVPEHAAAQLQLNTELNEAAATVDSGPVESDIEITATVAILPTSGGTENKSKDGKVKKEKRGADNVPKTTKKSKSVTV